jgi:hypothetical protein
MQTYSVTPLRLGSWRDTWSELKDKYNETFNPDVETPLKPAGTALAPAQGVESKFMGIPSTWLLYGGLAAIGVAAVTVLAKKGSKKKK